MVNAEGFVEQMFNADSVGQQSRTIATKVSGQQRDKFLEHARSIYVSGIGLGDTLLGGVDAEPVTPLLLGRTKLADVTNSIQEGFTRVGETANLEDATMALLASYTDASRLLDDGSQVMRAVRIGKGISTGSTIGYGQLLTNQGLWERGEGHYVEAVTAYEQAADIFETFSGNIADLQRYNRAGFRNLDVMADCLFDGITARDLDYNQFGERAETLNNQREKDAEGFIGRENSYSIAARKRGQLLSWRAVEENDSTLLAKAAQAYEIALGRLPDGEDSWAGAILRLHQAEVLSRSVGDFSNLTDVPQLEETFNRFLDRREYIPEHSLRDINGERIKGIAQVLDANGSFGYMNRVNKILKLD
jgi:tetratricopeptide (TPR) repeat protein